MEHHAKLTVKMFSIRMMHVHCSETLNTYAGDLMLHFPPDVSHYLSNKM